MTLYIDNLLLATAVYRSTQRSIVGGADYIYCVNGQTVVCHGMTLAGYVGGKAHVRIDETEIHILSLDESKETGRGPKALSQVLRTE